MYNVRSTCTCTHQHAVFTRAIWQFDHSQNTFLIITLFGGCPAAGVGSMGEARGWERLESSRSQAKCLGMFGELDTQSKCRDSEHKASAITSLHARYL